MLSKEGIRMGYNKEKIGLAVEEAGIWGSDAEDANSDQPTITDEEY